eukprot:1340079-Pleurochrysis_carterae.AAC.1
MFGWTGLCKWSHLVATLPVTNGTVRHVCRMTDSASQSMIAPKDWLQLVLERTWEMTQLSPYAISRASAFLCECQMTSQCVPRLFQVFW